MKAIALLSGGLDSTLAVKLMKDEGIQIVALNFQGPFCTCSHTGCRYVSKDWGCEFKTIFLGQDYLDMIKKPNHGYGKNLNPCLDCRIFIFKKAKEMLKKLGASFVITGEVLGQRPMSQHRQALDIIEKVSGLKGLILRPLSAKLLAQTIPEQKGWVNRERLLNISGRGRKVQLSLAKKSGIKENFCTAGGCLLTDIEYSRKVADLIKHNCLNIEEAKLLKVGRHFRLNNELKLIVGRNEKENHILEKWIAQKNSYLIPRDINGPFGLFRGNFNKDEAVYKAASIIARYCNCNPNEKTVKIKFIQPPKERIIQARPFDVKFIDRFRI